MIPPGPRPVRRFPIRFSGPNRYLWLLGVRPSRSWVDVAEDRVAVRLSWGFRMDVPRSSVRSAAADHAPVRAWGAHGCRGRWLVNGSRQGVVRLNLDPPPRDRVAAVLLPRVRELRVSVEDPDGLLRALAPSP